MLCANPRRTLQAIFMVVASISALGVTIPPQAKPSTAVIIDASGSMLAVDAGGQSRMDAAKQATEGLLADLPEDQQLALLTYGTETGSADEEKAAGCQDVRTLVPLGGDRKSMLDEVRKLNPRGYTPIGASLLQAERELPKEGHRQIVLVSDGIDTCAPPPVCEVAKEIKQRGVDVVINVIGLNVDEQARAELQCIAKEGGGSYADAQDAASLKEQLVLKSTRTLQKFTTSGNPVKGTLTPDNAPLLELGGLKDGKPAPTHYQDSLNESEPVHYKVKLEQGERFAIGFMTPPPPITGNDGGSYLNQKVEITDSSGARCVAEQEISAIANEFNKPSAGFAVSKVAGGGTGTCQPGEFDIQMRIDGRLVGGRTLPFEFKLWKIPHGEAGAHTATSGAEAPTDVNLDLGESKGPLPHSFASNEVPIVEPGVYDAEIVPGEMMWFKVPVQEGQRLQLKLQVPPIYLEDPEDEYRARGRSIDWLVLNELLMPVNTEALVDGKWDLRDALDVQPDREVKTATVSKPISWANLESEASMNGFLSGEQFVVLRYNTFLRGGNESTQSVPVKFKLGFEPLGSAVEGPTLSYEQTATTATSTSTERAAAGDAGEVSGSANWLVIAFGLLAVVVFGAGVGAFVLKRK